MSAATGGLVPLACWMKSNLISLYAFSIASLLPSCCRPPWPRLTPTDVAVTRMRALSRGKAGSSCTLQGHARRNTSPEICRTLQFTGAEWGDQDQGCIGCTSRFWRTKSTVPSPPAGDQSIACENSAAGGEGRVRGGLRISVAQPIAIFCTSIGILTFAACSPPHTPPAPPPAQFKFVRCGRWRGEGIVGRSPKSGGARCILGSYVIREPRCRRRCPTSRPAIRFGRMTRLDLALAQIVFARNYVERQLATVPTADWFQFDGAVTRLAGRPPRDGGVSPRPRTASAAPRTTKPLISDTSSLCSAGSRSRMRMPPSIRRSTDPVRLSPRPRACSSSAVMPTPTSTSPRSSRMPWRRRDFGACCGPPSRDDSRRPDRALAPLVGLAPIW